MLRLVPVFIVALFLSFNWGTLIYVKSSFLGGFFSETAVSLIFLLAALSNIALFFLAPHILNRLGKEKMLFLFILVVFIGTLILSGATTSGVAILGFIIYESFLFVAYWTLDIFVEKESLDKFTGDIRGAYFTLINAGILIGPLLVAFISPGEELGRVYSLGAFILLFPLLLSFIWLFRKKGVVKSEHPPHFLPFKAWWRSRNVRAVTFARLVLETFYALMVIYTPIYLHSRLGFEWGELGVVFAIALLPFVLFEWPAGFMADHFWGEKEMMGFGFLVMGAMLVIMPFINGALWLWAVILFASRVGAALVEITTESYFFKKINVAQTGFLSIFRLARPMGLVVGATIGALTVANLPFSTIFLVVALVVVLGLRESLYLKDTL